MERLHLRRPLRIDDRLERLVLDVDGSSRAAGLLGLIGRDDGDWLAEVAHAVDGQHRLVRELEPVRLPPPDVLVRQDRVYSAQCKRCGDVDPEDARVRVRAPHGLAPEHPGRMEVARVGELAGDLRDRVLATGERGRVPSPNRGASGGAHSLHRGL